MVKKGRKKKAAKKTEKKPEKKPRSPAQEAALRRARIIGAKKILREEGYEIEE